MDYLVPDSGSLLNTRFTHMARNTVDYWMLPDSDNLTESDLISLIGKAPVTDETTLQLYLHIPFCAQSCSFCAFTGGNSLEFKQAEQYVNALVTQMHKLLSITPAYGVKRIRSVHIGGGSPDLLRSNIGRLLSAVRDLDGMDEKSELAIECAPASTGIDFLQECIEYNVTKLSFGIQSIDPAIRQSVRMPRSLRKVDEICAKVAGEIPIVNADFITGLPGQTLKHVDDDLVYALNHPVINAVSSYLLTPGAAPSLIADVKSGKVPTVPTHELQAHMRLHTYTTLQKAGWVRRGTNTYMDREAIASEVLENIPGNECLGAADFDTFLVAAGAQAIGSVPGVRFENIVDIGRWMASIQAGGYGMNLKKSAIGCQKDMSLWTFPLFYQGLSRPKLHSMIAAGDVSQAQVNTLRELVAEGLIVEREEGYTLSILGEVFMGHLVRLLKKPEGRELLDAYISEGYAIGSAIKNGKIAQSNRANDRQTVINELE